MNRQARHLELKRRLAQGPVIGTFTTVSHPALVELMAWVGFDVICVDTEHASTSCETVEQLVRAADAGGAPCLVRVGTVDEIARTLDSGAAGVLVPHVETRMQAEAIVAAVRYPPLGKRGAGPGRAARYGLEFPLHVEALNDSITAGVMIETAAGVESAGEIASLAGLDMVFVGPGDLAVSLGCETRAPELVEAARHVIEVAIACGTAPGIYCSDADDVATWTACGARLIMLGGDLTFASHAASSTLLAAREAVVKNGA